MDLIRLEHNALRYASPGREIKGQFVSLLDEGRIHFAVKTAEEGGTQVLLNMLVLCNSQGGRADAHINRTNKELPACQPVTEGKAKDDGEDPSAQKAFHSLLGRQFDELGSTKSDAAYVCKDVIANDQRRGQQEPNHAFKDVVHDEVGLDNDEVQSNVGPGKLSELEAVVAFLKRADKEDKT